MVDGDARIVPLTLTDREMSGETETEYETLGECVSERLGSVDRVSAALLESERSGVCDRVSRGVPVVEREMSGEADALGHADDVFDILADAETVPQAEDDLEPEGERVSTMRVPVARSESDAAAETEAAALSVSMKVVVMAMDDVIEGEDEIFGDEEIDKDTLGERVRLSCDVGDEDSLGDRVGVESAVSVLLEQRDTTGDLDTEGDTD